MMMNFGSQVGDLQMKKSENMDELNFFEIEPASIFLGNNKGSQMYVQEQPMHEVKLQSKFKISDCITKEQWAKIMTDDENLDFTLDKYKQPADGVSSNDIDLFIEKLNKINGKEKGIYRLPSEAEWELSYSKLGEKFVMPIQGEIIADSPFPSYWGAPCDGRPRIDYSRSQESQFKITKKPHLIKTKKPVRGVIRVDEGQENVGFRVVWRDEKINEKEGVNLPDEPNKIPLLKRELIFFLILGAIPSSLIAGYNNYEYLKDSFLSVLLGGFFFSLITSFIWRPKRPIWIFDSETNKMIQR